MLMANSVEGRFPFLDHRIAEFGMRLPVQLKMPGLNEKYLLKRLARRLVPDSIISRPKQPYRAPDASSFFDAHGNARHDYVLDALSENAVRMTGLFDPAKVAGLVRKCAAGRATGVKDNQAFVGILSTQLLTLAN
jgi:asparagine synthase (glutamine-hydrolysing)